jgi:hypothetical protein
MRFTTLLCFKLRLVRSGSHKSAWTYLTCQTFLTFSRTLCPKEIFMLFAWSTITTSFYLTETSRTQFQRVFLYQMIPIGMFQQKASQPDGCNAPASIRLVLVSNRLGLLLWPTVCELSNMQFMPGYLPGWHAFQTCVLQSLLDVVHVQFLPVGHVSMNE